MVDGRIPGVEVSDTNVLVKLPSMPSKPGDPVTSDSALAALTKLPQGNMSEPRSSHGEPSSSRVSGQKLQLRQLGCGVDSASAAGTSDGLGPSHLRAAPLRDDALRTMSSTPLRFGDSGLPSGEKAPVTDPDLAAFTRPVFGKKLETDPSIGEPPSVGDCDQKLQLRQFGGSGFTSANSRGPNQKFHLEPVGVGFDPSADSSLGLPSNLKVSPSDDDALATLSPSSRPRDSEPPLSGAMSSSGSDLPTLTKLVRGKKVVETLGFSGEPARPFDPKWKPPLRLIDSIEVVCAPVADSLRGLGADPELSEASARDDALAKLSPTSSLPELSSGGSLSGNDSEAALTKLIQLRSMDGIGSVGAADAPQGSSSGTLTASERDDDALVKLITTPLRSEPADQETCSGDLRASERDSSELVKLMVTPSQREHSDLSGDVLSTTEQDLCAVPQVLERNGSVKGYSSPHEPELPRAVSDVLAKIQKLRQHQSEGEVGDAAPDFELPRRIPVFHMRGDHLRFGTLPYCAFHGELDSARYLLRQARGFADEILVNVTDGAGRSALHYAAYEGSAGMVQELLEAAADVFQVDHHGCYPLHVAASRGHFECARLMIGTCVGRLRGQWYRSIRSARASGAPLEDSSGRALGDYLRALQALRKTLFGHADLLGFTSLHYASRDNALGCLHILKMLVTSMMEFGSGDKVMSDPRFEPHGTLVGLLSKHMPVHHVREIRREHLRQVQTLQRELINGRDVHGLSLLHYAAAEGNYRAVHVLVSHNADVDAKVELHSAGQTRTASARKKHLKPQVLEGVDMGPTTNDATLSLSRVPYSFIEV